MPRRCASGTARVESTPSRRKAWEEPASHDERAPSPVRGPGSPQRRVRHAARIARMTSGRLGLGLALVTLALDQGTKLYFLFVDRLALPLTLAPFLELIVIWNRG